MTYTHCILDQTHQVGACWGVMQGCQHGMAAVHAAVRQVGRSGCRLLAARGSACDVVSGCGGAAVCTCASIKGTSYLEPSHFGHFEHNWVQMCGEATD
jgi:hypothetical protein